MNSSFISFIKSIMMGLGLCLLLVLMTYCSILNKKTTIALDLKQDSDGNIIVFSPELEKNDYIWEYLIGIYKDGIIVEPYDFEIRCSSQIDDCVKKAQDLQLSVDKKIIISPQSEIIFPKEILERGAVSLGIRTIKYERKSSHLSFCVKNNRLITSNNLENNLDFFTYCDPDYYTSAQLQEQKRITSQ